MLISVPICLTEVLLPLLRFGLTKLCKVGIENG
jgi:hypothetical protein